MKGEGGRWEQPFAAEGRRADEPQPNLSIHLTQKAQGAQGERKRQSAEPIPGHGACPEKGVALGLTMGGAWGSVRANSFGSTSSKTENTHVHASQFEVGQQGGHAPQRPEAFRAHRGYEGGRQVERGRSRSRIAEDEAAGLIGVL
jgi:hypothetical protein